MAGYAIGDVEVLNEEAYGEYRRRFDAILAQFGGRILINGGRPDPVEGNWEPRRLVVLEFPSVDLARQWLSSSEYGEIAPIPQEHATTHFQTIVERWHDPDL